MSDVALHGLYTEMLLARLPLGDASIWRGAVMVATARGLAAEGARTHEDAMNLLNGYMPDTAEGPGLELWEVILQLNADDLTTEQRQGQIMARLRGGVDPTRANLELVLQALVPDARLVSLPDGDQARGIANVLPLAAGDPDDLDDVSYVALSGVTDGGTETGPFGDPAQIWDFTGGGTATVSLVGSTTDSFRVSLWLKTSPLTVADFEHHNGTTWVVNTGIDGDFTWQNYIFEIPAGSTTPGWRIHALDPASISVAWVLTGMHNAPLERAVADVLQVPRHAVLEIGIAAEHL